MTSGEFLKNLRNKQGLSLRALGLLSKVSHTQISDLEKNVNFGTSEKLERILSALQATQEEMKKYYYLRDCEKTPQSIIFEIENLKKEIQSLRTENIKLKQQISINNNNNIGNISAGNVTFSINDNNSNLSLEGLSTEQIEEVKKYIEFLKVQNKIKGK